MHGDLVHYEVVYLDSSKGRDIRYGILTFKNPAHFWSSDCHTWGTRIEEHRFNPILLTQFSSVLDQIEADLPSISGLILRAEGKYFSNGVDLRYIETHPGSGIEIQKALEKIMGRLLSLGVVTVALLNGHATATGGILALCCDYRVMAERGFFFLPAVELGIVYSQGFLEVVKSKVDSPHLQRDMLLFSKRYTSSALHNIGLVEKVVTEETGLEECLAIIRGNHQINHGSLSEVKKRLYKTAISELMEERISDMHWDNITKSRL
ncbi:hypothetical protein C9890_0452 [Perkinsus sp. BL_2016]|nr:hypothetical protein C9890_0452 [Perkinsus sp. BL_2016]